MLSIVTTSELNNIFSGTAGYNITRQFGAFLVRNCQLPLVHWKLSLHLDKSSCKRRPRVGQALDCGLRNRCLDRSHICDICASNVLESLHLHQVLIRYCYGIFYFDL